MTTTLRGTFYGLGVGPGDPDLMTVKARRILESADVVLVPKRSLTDDGYAYGIVRDIIDPARQEVRDLHFPMTKDVARLEPIWEEHGTTIAGYLARGLTCAFVTEGDPFFYSTFIYLWQRLRSRYPQYPMEVVPGVSSVQAAACRADVPLASGDDRIAILPATYEAGQIRRFLEDFDTVVFLKCNSVFPALVEALEATGLKDRAVYIKKATSPQEEIVRDLDSLAGRKLEYLSLLLVKREGTRREPGGGCGRPARAAAATAGGGRGA